MELVAKDDVLGGLKKFKRLAKQDLLASTLTSDPEFWRAMAEARRRKYAELMDLIERNGVEWTRDQSLQDYARLPLLEPDDHSHPDIRGEEQALEMFFSLLGTDRKTLRELRSQRPPSAASTPDFSPGQEMPAQASS
ncbi:MAG: hypothetical protein IMW99_04005 [Firmicutes bacterium]|nr:hypothetical protein [Bacillota bacterium]